MAGPTTYRRRSGARQAPRYSSMGVIEGTNPQVKGCDGVVITTAPVYTVGTRVLGREDSAPMNTILTSSTTAGTR